VAVMVEGVPGQCNGKTFASLFTGAGLADVGAMLAGYRLIWGVELNPATAAVAAYNLGHPVHVASVIGFDWASVERPDHLHMSPPCQDFSVAKRKVKGATANPNDDLSNACIEALKALQPNSCTLENVEAYRKAPGFQRIVDHLWGAGYWVHSGVLNSADFSVPQTRRRLMLRAVRGAMPAPLPEPTPWVGWYEAIEDLIPTLPETQFAQWQLDRLPELTVMTNTGDCPGNLPRAYLVEAMNASRNSTVRDIDAPAITVITDHKPSHQLSALLVSSVDCTARANHEPATTVVCVGDGHSVSPRALLVDELSAEDRAMGCMTADEREQHEYEELRRWADERNNAPRALLVDDKNNETLGIDAALPASAVRVGNGAGNIKAHTSGRVVRMTPRALARFQSVPDWYVLPNEEPLSSVLIEKGLLKPKSNGMQLACLGIGNGVPPKFMAAVLPRADR